MVICFSSQLYLNNNNTKYNNFEAMLSVQNRCLQMPVGHIVENISHKVPCNQGSPETLFKNQ